MAVAKSRRHPTSNIQYLTSDISIPRRHGSFPLVPDALIRDALLRGPLRDPSAAKGSIRC
jgi:hypothetical protein